MTLLAITIVVCCVFMCYPLSKWRINYLRRKRFLRLPGSTIVHVSITRHGGIKWHGVAVNSDGKSINGQTDAELVALAGQYAAAGPGPVPWNTKRSVE